MDSDPSGGDSNLFFLLNFLFQIYIWRFKSICQRFESLGFFSNVFTSSLEGFRSFVLKIWIVFLEQTFWNRDSNWMHIRFKSFSSSKLFVIEIRIISSGIRIHDIIFDSTCILLMRIRILDLEIRILSLDMAF